MDRRLETSRLIIFLLATFAISWIPLIIVDCYGFRCGEGKTQIEQLLGLCMFAPAIGHIFTRWITKEGWAVVGKDSMKLGISLADKKWRYFLFAMLVPWLYSEIGNGLRLLTFPGIYDSGYAVSQGLNSKMAYVYPLAAIITGVVVNCAAFGEEFGWRGYMMPKMIKLWGIKKAIFIGGIIWGIWHAPLTVVGHNFGTDYPGFPYVGILLMCILCTFMGMMLTYITIKSGSIWPAAIMHAVNNAGPTVLAWFINPDKVDQVCANILVEWIFMLIPIIVIGSTCMVFLCKQNKVSEE